MRRRATVPALLLLILLPVFRVAAVYGEVIEAGDSHYRLSHTAVSTTAPEELWDRLLQPALWWNPAHSYSGKADNLQLDARAGGLWREDWEGGSVSHGRVLQVIEGQLLRLEAPFGPLQGIGAYVIWTIRIEPDGSGSRILFDEVAFAPPQSSLDAIARAVDAVKGEAIARLAQ